MNVDTSGRGRSRPGRRWFAALAAAVVLASPPAGAASLRVDVFVGYDGVVPHSGWFPITFEVANDGPSFTALFEVEPAYSGQGQVRTMVVELPTGTTKRFLVPIHSAGGFNPSWNVRVFDERRRLRMERQTDRVRRQFTQDIPIAASLSRALPALPEIKAGGNDLQPVFARLQAPLFPDTPIALEGLDTLYLSSERALELKAPQVNALLGWLHGGGHLVVGFEQIGHVTGNDWLRRLLPFQPTNLVSVAGHAALHDWVAGKGRFDGREYSFVAAQTNAPASTASRRGRPTPPPAPTGPTKDPFAEVKPDEQWHQTPFLTAVGPLRDGRALVGPADTPLVLTARRGRGQLTVLTFAPELEPFRSWKNAPWFWAKMTDLPVELLSERNYSRHSGPGIDGVFGALVDSRQVRKLPVGWLLLLLLGYLAVIGPLDQYWLKKLNKQMLTWLTFPAYVAFFSVLIYFIGYKLRAGETEWNEIHLVDLLPHAGQPGQADWRGRSYASVYSPVNARYRVASDQPFAALRGEFSGHFGRGQEISRATVEQHDNTFRGAINVPVWTSQLYVNDWWRQDALPLAVTLTAREIKIENRLDVPVTDARLVMDGQVHSLGRLPPGQTTVLARDQVTRTPLAGFVTQHVRGFQQAINARQRAFGDETRGRLYDATNTVLAASFLGEAESSTPQPNQFGHSTFRFTTPPGLDLSPLARRGDVFLLAWAPGHSPIKPIHQFSPRRSHRDTLFRLAVATEE